MLNSNFNFWFAEYLECKESDVQQLLNDKTAMHFLIAWSIFESKCFNGYIKAKEIYSYSKNLTTEKFPPGQLNDWLKYFYERYQDNNLLRNLMYKHKHPDIKPLLKKNINNFSDEEKIFFLTTVVYRYRNNIFHGTKGIDSWLKFKDQINKCTRIMQILISHSKDKSPPETGAD